MSRSDGPPEARWKLLEGENQGRRGSPDLLGPPAGGTPQSGTPLLGFRRPPRPSTPSTAPVSPTHTNTPPHSGTPQPEDSVPSSRRSSLLPPCTDSRRGSQTKKALTGLVKDARKGIKDVKDTSMKAGQKVKDKTVSVSGHMKDATVGASQWVASQTSKTAKAAMDQAKSGLSLGEKFTLFAVEKISTFSRKGFTHVFMFLILAGYTALGALLFMALEAPHEEEIKHKYEEAKITLIETLWENTVQNRAINFSNWEKIVDNQLKNYDDQLKLSWSAGISTDPDDRIWTFWKTMFFCSTITTTIGYGHIFPRTNAGRALTIVYAILGIPIFLILMADFGKLFTRLLKSLFVFVRRLYRTSTCRRVRKSRAVQSVKAWMRKARVWCGSLCRRKEDVAVEDATPESEEEAVIDDNFNLPISLALLILLAYMVIGCVIYTMWESWTYFEAFYFIFISMTTIGFGDYVPQHPAFMMMTTVYLVFGLALTAMCINIIQEKLSDTFRHASEKLKDSLGHIMAAATQGEEGALQEGKEVEVAEVHGGNIQTPTITVKKET